MYLRKTIDITSQHNILMIINFREELVEVPNAMTVNCTWKIVQNISENTLKSAWNMSNSYKIFK